MNTEYRRGVKERRYGRILSEADRNKERERREEIRRNNARARELIRERLGR